MPRRKQSPAEMFMELLCTLPPWVSLVAGTVACGVVKFYQREYQDGARGILHLLVAAFPAYLLLIMGCVLALISAVRRVKHRQLVDRQTGLESLRATGWKDFEFLVAEAFRRQGYQADCSMDTGADGGVDIVLRRDGRTSLVQCKRWRQVSVGGPVVREMFGLLHDQRADHAFIVSTGEFTPDARAFAAGKPMTLINGTQLWEMVRSVQSAPDAAQRTPAEVTPRPANERMRVSVVPKTWEEEPRCPVCAESMVKRVAKQGASLGNTFWGCRGFPKCRGTRPMVTEK